MPRSIALFFALVLTFTASPCLFVSAETAAPVQYEQAIGISDDGITALDKDTPPAEAPVVAAPILVADVNFNSVTVLSESEAWRIRFGIGSTFGSQDAVSVGVIVRDATGQILDHQEVLENLFLPEGETLAQSITYVPPKYIRSDAKVYLTAYTARGLTLAIEEIGDLKQIGEAPFLCEQSESAWVCRGGMDSQAFVRIQEGGPFGRIIAETQLFFAANSPQTVDFAEITNDFPAGPYVISLLSGGEDRMITVSVVEYGKMGNRATIVSVAPKVVETERAKRLQVRVYAEAFSIEGATHALSAKTGHCDIQTRLLDAPVADFVFDMNCTGSNLRIDLLADGVVADTLTVSLLAPEQESVQWSSVMLKWRDRLLYGIFGLFATSLAFIAGKKLMSRRKGVIGVLAVLAFLGSVDVSPAQAATYVIGGQARYVGCITGGWPGCAEPDPSDRGYITTGTVTVPNSVGPNQPYTISITQSLTSSALTQCKDTAAATYAVCGPTHVSTEGFINLPPPGMATVYGEFLWDYNTLPAGYGNSLSGYLGSNPSTASIGRLGSGNPSGVFSRTSPASGVADVLAFVQIASSGFSIRCTDNCITYPYAYNSVSVPMATTTCDLGCGGSVQWRANASNAIDDFTCPSGSKLITNRGSWTGPLACQGTFTLDPNGGTMSCVADASCSSTCSWQSTAYIDGRQPPGAAALHNSTYCSTPAPSDGSPNDSLCNAANSGRTAVCCDTGADCFRYSCSCAPPSGTPCWKLSSTRTQSAASCTYPMSPPLGPAFPACAAGNQGALERRCDDDQPMLDLESTYMCGMCVGSGPTLIMTGARQVGYDDRSLWRRLLASLKQDLIGTAAASGPAVNIVSGESVLLNWTTTGAASCTLTVPGQLPQSITPAQIASGTTVVSGLSVGSHIIRMTCADTTGTQIVMDTVTVNVASNALRICPSAVTLVTGTVYQMRAFYLLGGVDCAAPGLATEVTDLVTWSSSAPLIATVGNAGTAGRITTLALGQTNITISSYAGHIAPAAQVTVTGGYAICPANASTYIGGTTQLRAYYSALGPINCGNLAGATDVTGSVTWLSSNSTIATVSAGLVTGVSSGLADISVSSYAGATALPVTVVIGGGYRICPPSAIVGSTGFSFHAYYNASGAVNCSNLAGTTDVTGSVTWMSSNPGVATVGNGGTAGVTMPAGIGSSNISTTPYSGIPSGNAVANVICIPSVSCASAGPAATAANTCPSQNFTIDDGCGYSIVCPGTRTCDFNWKEVGQ